MKTILSLFVCLIINFQLFSQQEVSRVGTSAAQFLKLGVGARACALGEAMVATAGDVTNLYWNPAGIASINKKSLTVSRNELYTGLSYNFAGFVLPIDNSSALGAQLLYLDSGEMEVTTIVQPEGTGESFAWQSFCCGVSYSRFVTDRLQLGGTIKYVREGSYGLKAHTMALDVGSLLETGILGFRLGLAISNVGGEMRFSSPPAQFPSNYYGNEDILVTKAKLATQSFPLPLTFRLGAATELIGKNGQLTNSDVHRMTFSIEASDPNDAFLSSNFGIEYEWHDLLSLRAGYRGLAIENDPIREYRTSSYALGLGLHYVVKLFAIQFDYAFADFRILGGAHHFTLGVCF
ncbi:MAG: PorV/PorQ family protein [candidate division KSB1 bacterium]|nr:PorV/PorQ family protein [candidate division KSB1 bacterium]MDZ7342282.1 PorV/PorQ family protein [candidate division KSB1 bacterium]